MSLHVALWPFGQKRREGHNSSYTDNQSVAAFMLLQDDNILLRLPPRGVPCLGEWLALRFNDGAQHAEELLLLGEREL